MRGWVLTGFPWNQLGMIWLDVPPIAHLASTIGVLGLSGVAILAAAVLRQLLKDRRGARQIAFIAASVVLLVVWPDADYVQPSSEGPTVRVVQGNIPQHDKWNPALAIRHRRSQLALSGARAGSGRPRLIFWPEAAIPEDIMQRKDVRRELAATLGPHDLLLVGAVAIQNDNSGRPSSATNSVFILNHEAEIVARYDKSRLVPFGEYIPTAAAWLGLARLTSGAVEFVAGTGPATLHLPRLPAIGVSVCYEADFSGSIVRRTDRPLVIFNPSNDAWFGEWGAFQHLAQARMRAIEEGLPVVRATPTGISAIISANGEIVASIPRNTAGYLEAILPPSKSPTMFARSGNSAVLAAALLCLVVASLFAYSFESNWGRKGLAR